MLIKCTLYCVATSPCTWPTGAPSLQVRFYQITIYLPNLQPEQCTMVVRNRFTLHLQARARHICPDKGSVHECNSSRYHGSLGVWIQLLMLWRNVAGLDLHVVLQGLPSGLQMRMLWMLCERYHSFEALHTHVQSLELCCVPGRQRIQEAR